MPDWTLTALNAVGNFAYHVSPAVAGVIVGGWIIQRYWVKKSNEAAIVDYIVRELSDLVDDTLLYWSIDCSGTGTKADADRKQATQLAAQIKAASHNLNAVLRSYCNRYCARDSFDTLWSEVHDACTGGEFEVAKRPADPHRYSRVVSSTHRIRWRLYERRV